ncbi:MAG: DEAD/DEAH box helicase, partial [Gordonia sp. (in: high G+C Gram-positive bacteria)]
SVSNEDIEGGFARIYKALNVFEDNGQVRRGYFVDGLGGAQFASAATVDELRRHAATGRDRSIGARDVALVLAATDPANPYGAALAWPQPAPEAGGHRPGRKPGALVVLVDGTMAGFIERGGKTVLTFTDDPAVISAMACALANSVRSGRVIRLLIDQIDGVNALRSPWQQIFVEAGFATVPRGLRLRFVDHV